MSKGGAVPESGVDRDHFACRETVLVLRLKLDQRARLRQGELLDAAATGLGRFASVAGLAEAIQQWLDQQRRISEEE